MAGIAKIEKRSYSMTRQKVGVGLVVAAYVLLLYLSLFTPLYAREHPYLDPVLAGEFASTWPVALACAIALAGIVLALVPLRRGERWALWTQLAIFIILFVPRMMTDPRCLVVLDPHQHGCHTFMIAVVLGVIGLVLARR
jgi:cytochrome bd-type quinol oxidase subunit 2